MPTTTDLSRTARLRALMKKGDDAFNARDFERRRLRRAASFQ